MKIRSAKSKFEQYSDVWVGKQKFCFLGSKAVNP